MNRPISSKIEQLRRQADREKLNHQGDVYQLLSVKKLDCLCKAYDYHVEHRGKDRPFLLMKGGCAY